MFSNVYGAFCNPHYFAFCALVATEKLMTYGPRIHTEECLSIVVAGAIYCGTFTVAATVTVGLE